MRTPPPIFTMHTTSHDWHAETCNDMYSRCRYRTPITFTLAEMSRTCTARPNTKSSADLFSRCLDTHAAPEPHSTLSPTSSNTDACLPSRVRMNSKMAVAMNDLAHWLHSCATENNPVRTAQRATTRHRPHRQVCEGHRTQVRMRYRAAHAHARRARGRYGELCR